MAPASPALSPALSYVGQQVRRFDNDRFLTSLFAPPDRREALFALYAFNSEIARTREAVTEPILGQIRLQWWRDSIAALYDGQVSRHEVLQPLAAAIRQHDLPQAAFDRLIDSREADLDDEPPADLPALLDYATATGAPLLELALAILGWRGPAVGPVAAAAGAGWALTGLLRAVPFHARQHRLMLPAALLDSHNVVRSAVFELKSQPALAPVAAAVADSARQHLAAARQARRQVPGPARTALLLVTLADQYLSALARAGHDPFDRRLLVPPALRHVRLAAAALTGRY